MRNIVDRESTDLVYAADPALDLRVEILEGLGTSEDVLRAQQLPLGRLESSERNTVLVRVALAGRQPVAKTGMMDSLRKCPQSFEFDQIVTSARATMADVVVNDLVDRHLGYPPATWQS